MSQVVHPQYVAERHAVDALKRVEGKPENEHLAELARLLIRFKDFPGAYDLQQDLQLLLKKWSYTTETLFEITRQIHAQGVYELPSKRDDWT